MTNSVAFPEDNIFSPSMNSASDCPTARDLTGRTLAATSLRPSIVQYILYFVWPERVWLTRLPPHNRKLLRQDFNSLRVHLQNDRTTNTKAGLPVTLFFGAPGAWAIHLPRLGQSEKEKEQDMLCLSHRPEEFALTSRLMAKHGSALRTLRIAVDLGETPAAGAPAHGAAALLFALLARGDLGRLNHLTVIHAGGGGAVGCSYFAPLSRSGSALLGKLKTLRLALAEPHVPFRHLADLALRGGLPNLESLVLLGDVPVEDAAVATLLRALPSRPSSPMHPLHDLDLRASRAGPETLGALVSLLEEGRFPVLRRGTVNLEGTPAAGAEMAGLREKMDFLLIQQAGS